MSTPVWFGDIAVSFLTDKDTSIEKEVVEKNFVDSPPQVFEVDVSLEAGTYNIVHNEQLHPENESLEEQIDAAQSMPSRHASELPFELAGDKGHVMVETANSTITPSQEFRESSVDLRFFEDDVFRPSYVVDANSYNSVFDTTPTESVLTIPNTVEDVIDSSETPLTESFTVTGRDGDMDYYLYDDREVIEFERNSSDYTIDERTNPLRVFDSNSNRIYSDIKPLRNGSTVDNGLVKFDIGISDTDLSLYDSSSWKQLGSVNFGMDDGYASENTNNRVEVTTTDPYYLSLRRGFTVGKFTLGDTLDFRLTADGSFTSGDTSSSWHRSVENPDGDELILIRTDSDGSFDDTSSYLEVNGLTNTKEYTFFVGVVPSPIAASDFARYVYNIGTQKRSMVQR